jgi:hypothetical protein
VRLVLEDPNNPREERLAPGDRTLDESVRIRLSTLREADAANPPLPYSRTFWRLTEWSEESEVVDFPAVRHMLAGEISGAKTYEVTGKRGKIVIKDAVAKVMALVWDKGRALWVPGVSDGLSRGSVANFTKDAWVLDPVTLSLRSLEKYTFHTGYTVADIYGGEELPTDNRKSKLTSPGEVLLLGEDGSLHVQSEFDDADKYANYFYGSTEEDSTGGRSKPRRDDGGSVPLDAHGL